VPPNVSEFHSVWRVVTLNVTVFQSRAVKTIVVTKQEILVISVTDFFHAPLRHHNDVILLPVIRRVSGRAAVGMGIPMGMVIIMGWVWGLKFNPHGSPGVW